MSNEKTQLPPELVENYEKLGVSNFNGETCTDLSEKCAQIAVEYADKWKEKYKAQMDVSFDFQQQRDELLEVLRAIQLTPSFEKALEKFGHFDSHWTNKTNKLINKIDGE